MDGGWGRVNRGQRLVTLADIKVLKEREKGGCKRCLCLPLQTISVLDRPNAKEIGADVLTVAQCNETFFNALRRLG